ncbi:2',3'-cyclic-nucleotide 3'-phosphodiesterase isoform X2 [Amblyraja radiata]|uniref:2',3'-cyclic-nucleotide 3'-phosphodiesterase isoform X2 n=1 Tax=Amblyraja radiata TaxID=386614 RepID=UPI001403C63E|nr:2',3'-cyclic-nucleotide 3'-phosphodiesterase isoform X2 [Amblyraja radiata]
MIGNLFKMGAKPSKSKSPVSCSFPFLEDKSTIEVMKETYAFVILRGLPGSGKSTVARQIAEKYPSISVVASADHWEITPLPKESETDSSRYDKLDQQIKECLGDKTIVVVDDTHHNRERLDYLFDLAKEKDYIVFIFDVRPANSDLASLVKCSHWNYTVQQLKLMEPELQKKVLPYYFGWFLWRQDGEKMRKYAMDFLDELSKNEKFGEEFFKYVKSDSKENFKLEEYFQKKPSVLHCTTKFCNYGAVPNSESYAGSKTVDDSLSKCFVLKVSALFITPRTLGARVELDEDQQLLWPKDEEAVGSGDQVKLPHSSRSHITLACAPGVPAVQTGLDLLNILKAENAEAQPNLQVMLEQGQCCCLGEGRWIMNLPNSIKVKTLFSGFYAKKKSTAE